MSAWFALYPHVGGGRGTYRPVVRYLQARAECHIPTLPGRDGRYAEGPMRRFSHLADDLWRQLREARSAGADPRGLVLFGFSMGALLATEMAVRLHREGVGCRGLVVAGSPPPELVDVSRPIAHLPEEDFVTALASHGIMTPDVLTQPELRELMVPIWRADCAAVESHPRTPARLSCPVVAVAGEDDPMVGPEKLAAWAAVGGDGSKTIAVPGRHGAPLEDVALVVGLLCEAAGDLLVRP